jgi:two-component system, sensor histidine kinase PdtaS
MKNAIFFLIALFIFPALSCRNKLPFPGNKASSGELNSDTSAVNSLIDHAITLVRKNPDSAIFYLNRTRLQSDSIHYVHGIGESWYFTGVAFFYKYRYDTALYLHKKAYSIFEKAGDKKGMAQACYSMSYDYSLMQDMQKSLESSEEAKKLLVECEDYNKVYDCIEALVFIHKQLHHNREVDSLLNELIAVAEKIRDKKKLANSYIVLGNHYVDQAYLNLAIEAFFKALKIAEESGDPVEQANALGSIGQANLYLREYETAVDYYNKQEEILKELRDNYQLSITYAGLGEAYNAMKNYPRGLEFHRRSLSIREKMKYKIAISNSLYNIAYTWFLMNDSTGAALQYINRSLAIDRAIHNYDGEAKNYMLLGKIHAYRKNNINTGIRYLEQSYEMARRYNNTDVIQEASGALSLLYAQKGIYDRAYANMIINNEISDSLISGENFKRITQLEMQHAFDKKQSDMEMDHLREKLKYETELKRNKMVRNFSLMLGSLIIAIGIFIYFSYRKAKKADHEKEALLKEIHHRVKNNLMVVSSLLNLQSGSITDENTKSAVRESQSRVKSMALIHQLLYQGDRFARIDFSKYLEQLMASLQGTYSRPGKHIGYAVNAGGVELDIDMAIPLGLITNELATNAYKYAFTEREEGRIEIDLEKTADHMYALRIADNGKGLPADFDPGNSNTLGLKLVKILSKQIKAKLSFAVNGGTEFRIVFAENIT